MLTGSIRVQKPHGESVFLGDVIMAYDKTIRTEYFAASRQVSRSPCWVFGFFVAGADASVKYAMLRNGHNANAPITIRWHARNTFASAISLTVPIYFSRGLYLEMESDLTAVTIQYQEVEP